MTATREVLMEALRPLSDQAESLLLPPNWPKIKWHCWLDGPRGLAISGTTLGPDGRIYELCANLGAICLRFDTKRVIRRVIAANLEKMK